MTAPRVFTDEDVYASLAPALRQAGIDALSTREAGRLRLADEAQLQFATEQGRTIVTFNVAHFAALHAQWISVRRSHAGIIVSSQRPIGDLLRRLVRLASQLDAASLIDRIEYLSDW